MKSWSLFSLFFSLVYCFSQTLQAKEAAVFHLNIDHLSPKTGDEAEITMNISESFNLTNMFKGYQSVTNWSSSFDFKFRERILIWDETNDYAKVEMLVGHCQNIYKNKTNEPVKLGDQFVGTLILGEWFAKSSDGKFSDKATTLFNAAYPIHPNRGTKGLDYLKLSQPRSIGESWKVFPDLSQLEKLNGSLGDYFTQLLIKGLNTNTVEVTAQFAGTTNVSEFHCFDLRILADINAEAGKPAKRVFVSGKTRLDMVTPFDTSQTFWIKNRSADMLCQFEEEKNGTNYIPAWGKASAKLTVECRGISQK
jgi:hypothetical protein